MRLLLVVALTLAITGTGSMPLAMAANGGLLSGSALHWIELGMGAARFAPIAPLLRSLDGSQAINYGSDGRLTVLLLGSDYRPGKGGDRTDVIMVVTINPRTREAAALSIPRDVARVPLPGGGTFSDRINALLKYYRRQNGLKGPVSMKLALPKVQAAIAYILRIQIDYYALIRFDGVEELVDEVGGVTVRIDKAWFDPKHPPTDPPGSYFPQSTAWQLYGASTPQCRGWYRNGPNKGQPGYYCHRALVFARSRKGSGNNDFVRAARQQRLVEATVKKVLARGRGSNLSALVQAGEEQVDELHLWTNIPLTGGNALAFYDLLSGFKLTRTVVLKPTTYAQKIPGTARYELKLDVVRSLTKSWFGPVN
jgi:LCP family protein required for cell wall assembly